MSRHPLHLPPSAGDFIALFRHNLERCLQHLDRPSALSLLGEAADIIARQRGILQVLEKSRGEMLGRARQADSYTELGEIEEAMTALETAQFVASGSVTGLHLGCTEFRDCLAERTVELVSAELESSHGPPPRPFALISMGSDGREEQTLVTDQDYLIVYADSDQEDGADEYFKAYAELLVERLAEIGFAKCTGDIMPSNPTWRGSLLQWKRRLLAIVRYEYEEYAKNLMDLIVLSDARYVAGDETIAGRLIDMIRDFERSYFQVLWGMARQATEMKVGLNIFGQLWTDRVGEHRGHCNIKLLGWAPLVMNIRILAVNNGLEATNTLQRIEQLEKHKRLGPTTAAELSESYHILTRHRIKLQIRQLRGEQENSYFLDPALLTEAEETELLGSMVAIKELQKVIRTNFATA